MCGSRRAEQHPSRAATRARYATKAFMLSAVPRRGRYSGSGGWEGGCVEEGRRVAGVWVVEVFVGAWEGPLEFAVFVSEIW